MSGPNGHAEANDSPVPNPLTAAPNVPSASPFTPEKVKEFVAALEVPFDPPQIEWRVMNTTKNGQPLRGQVVPYADQRAYTDRLNALFTPAGWTRKYTIHTSASFERSKDQKIVAKILVTCELTIFGLGSHSATGEEWADNDNAGTAAETLGFRHIGVVHDEYAVSPDGMKAFGVLDLATEMEGCRFSIGLRNSHDKSMRLAMTCGYR
jgi:Rad52/22 family double-strand break repair protein